ncbi:hypothetical protein FSP39_000526 [Pinctada imbricata]|uniref:Uncharacterized protein n=1 Tax=Pinctada imbricata TaxID=66713 RepID=A0AA88YGW5_PINIB|nr:hypothetical protein FSP39_000526 [Pinctada imbricata]
MSEPVLHRLARELGIKNNEKAKQTSSSLEEPICSDQIDVVAGQSSSTGQNEQQSVPSDSEQNFQNEMLKTLLEAQKSQFEELKSFVQHEIEATNKRFDNFVADLVISDEPPSKKQRILDSSNVASEISAAKSADTGDPDSVPTKNADTPKSADISNKAEDTSEKTPPTSMIARLADKFTPTEKTGPQISEGLADLLKSVIRERGSKKDEDKKRSDILDKNLRPENCDVLTPPKVNKEIWTNISSTARSGDLDYQKTQNVVLRAIGSIVNVVDNLLQKDPEGKDEHSTAMVDKLMESVSLLAYANEDLNQLRKNNIKNELNHDFRSLCSSQTPVTEYLFGDNISEQVKTIQDTNKVGKKVSSTPSSHPFLGSRPSWTGGSRKGKGGWGKSRYPPQNSQPQRNPQSGPRKQAPLKRKY